MSGGAPRGRVALLLLVTFAAGAAAGVAADRQLRRPEAEPAAEARRQGSREHGYTIERFADDLGLTAEQRAAIAPVLEDTRQRMREMSERVRPEYQRILDSALARIEAVLTPEQAIQYRELRERRKRDGRDEGRDGREAPGEDGSAGTDGQD